MMPLWTGRRRNKVQNAPLNWKLVEEFHGLLEVLDDWQELEVVTFRGMYNEASDGLKSQM